MALLTGDEWLARVGAHTEMGQLVAEFDWAATPLGPPRNWSVGLRTAVGICLTSSFPMLVVWGPDLIKIYNDGYRLILGRDKHPFALGNATRRVWPEIWDEIAPMFQSVLDTGQPTWVDQGKLMVERNGFLEECFFTWSYSPLFDDDGTIGGVLDVVHEVSEQVVAERRLACLHHLGEALVDANQVTDVCVRAVNALAEWPTELNSAEVYLSVGHDVARIASTTRDERNRLDDERLRMVIDSGKPIVVGESETAPGTMPAELYAAPLGGIHGGVRGALVGALNPERPFDAGYSSFLNLVVSAIGAALDSAYRRAIEVGEYRHISETLQQSMLSPASNLPTLAARFLPAAGNLAVGGDWYDVIELGPHRRAIVVGDCVGHGLGAATVMAQLRSAARAMLLDDRDPGATLAGLDAFAASTEGAYCASVVCAIVDRAAGEIQYARAGHPPPLLVGPHRSVWLDGGGGPLLAVGARPKRVTARHPLISGEDVLVMYTDGLVERRGETIDHGLQRLADEIEKVYPAPVAEMADHLLGVMLPPETRDDVVIVLEQAGHA